MFRRHFISTHQQVGEFLKIRPIIGGDQKVGGNVASYFCTPEGRVIHGVPGVAPTKVLLREAQWAIDEYAVMQDRTLAERSLRLADAHRRAAARPETLASFSHRGWSDSYVPLLHQYLAENSLVPLDQVFVHVFQNILLQGVSPRALELERVRQRLFTSKLTNKPLLFVVARGKETPSQNRARWDDLLASSAAGNGLTEHVARYDTFMLSLGELKLFQRRLRLPHYRLPGGKGPVFVVARPDGEQVGAVAGWGSLEELAEALKRGLASD